jgi:mono/diheme cytochrome c family protein
MIQLGHSLRIAAVVAALGVGATAAVAIADTPAESTPTAAATPWSDAWLLEQAPRYLDDGDARRAALEHSLANPDNLYSRKRLSAYTCGEDSGWDLLPEWNPRSIQLDDAAIEALVRGDELQLPDDLAPLWDGTRPTTMPEWVELGRRVFFSYPLRPEPFAAHALANPELARAVGLQRAADGSHPGTVVFRDIDGETKVGITCALCHSSVDHGAIVVGLARRSFDYGAMQLAWHDDTGVPIDPTLASRLASWGPGRADITEDDDSDPVAIPDLWRLRELRAFTQAGTIVHDDPLALAIRQETQILHANRERTRPPRELAWALAMYLYSLQPPAHEVAVDATAQRGRELFAKHCDGCHTDGNGSGVPVDVRRVGTDPALANGTSRGTGRYRPAPLVRVDLAAPYLHDGSVATLEDLLDPSRSTPGHTFGTRLPAHDRDALIAWLRTL